MRDQTLTCENASSSIRYITQLYYRTEFCEKSSHSTHQVHVVSPLEIVLHCSVVQPNPHIVMTQACQMKINMLATINHSNNP